MLKGHEKTMHRHICNLPCATHELAMRRRLLESNLGRARSEVQRRNHKTRAREFGNCDRTIRSVSGVLTPIDTSLKMHCYLLHPCRFDGIALGNYVPVDSSATTMRIFTLGTSSLLSTSTVTACSVLPISISGAKISAKSRGT